MIIVVGTFTSTFPKRVLVHIYNVTIMTERTKHLSLMLRSPTTVPPRRCNAPEVPMLLPTLTLGVSRPYMIRLSIARCFANSILLQRLKSLFTTLGMVGFATTAWRPYNEKVVMLLFHMSSRHGHLRFVASATPQVLEVGEYKTMNPRSHERLSTCGSRRSRASPSLWS